MSNSSKIQQYRDFRDNGAMDITLPAVFGAIGILSIALFPAHTGYVSVVFGLCLIALCTYRVFEGVLAIRAGYWQERGGKFGGKLSKLFSEYRGTKAILAATGYILLNILLGILTYFFFVKTGVTAVLSNL